MSATIASGYSTYTHNNIHFHDNHNNSSNNNNNNGRNMSFKILSKLLELRDRLVARDETLQRVYLWPRTRPALSSTYIAMFLEEAPIQQALQQCLQACATSPIVTTLHLGNLPEPDLEAALLLLAQQGGKNGNTRIPSASNTTASPTTPLTGPTALRKLCIGPLHASSGLSGQVLTKLLNMNAPQLEHVDCSCRVRIPHQAAVHSLAAAIGQLPALRHLRLHVVPRTSIERPSLRLDAILSSCRGLETLDLTAGYPDHNPYQQPVLTGGDVLTKFVARNPRLRQLTLENLGLESAHVQALTADENAWPEYLEQLHLPSNKRLVTTTTTEKTWASRLARQLQDPRHTTLSSVTVAGTTHGATRASASSSSSPPALLLLLEVDVWTTLNRWGRRRLVQATEGSTAHVQAFRDLVKQSCDISHESSSSSSSGQPTINGNPLLPLNLLYTLVRENPTLTVQSMS